VAAGLTGALAWALAGAGEAQALTLEEVVERVGQVDPNAVVAELNAAVASTQSLERWTRLAPDVGVTRSQQLRPEVPGGAAAGALTGRWTLLDAPALLDAAQYGALAQSAKAASGASTLDAQYAAAALYFQALAAEARLAAARQGVDIAKGTRDTARARVGAGVENELAGRTAELGVLQAEAELARAEAARTIARACLQRAMQAPLEGDLAAAEAPAAVEGPSVSPWLDVSRSDVHAARLATVEAWADLLPVGSLGARSPLGVPEVGWTVSFDLSWRLDGLVGPLLEARRRSLQHRITEVRLDALQRDLQLGIDVARAQALAAGRVAEAARAREALAEASLEVGQARLSAGVAAPLEVLRLQDDFALARRDRVEAELQENLARLEAARLAGRPWARASR
jgi:outer membrane protein TolC